MLPDYMPGLAFGVKQYQTAVGLRQVHYYLSTGDGINQAFYGVFFSEGRNVVSSCMTLVPVDATEGKVKEICNDFLTKCEEHINQSYARKLYLDHKHIASF